MSYNINYEKGNSKGAEELQKLYKTLIKEPKSMALTMREFLRKVGREEGLQKERASLYKMLKKHSIDPEPYKHDFEKLAGVEEILDLYGDVLTADDPRAFLRKRFGH